MAELELAARLFTTGAVTLVLTALAIYFVRRARRNNMDTPAVWGATVATTGFACLSALEVGEVLTASTPSAWLTVAIRLIIMAGIGQFWIFYRRVIVTDPKKQQPKQSGA